MFVPVSQKYDTGFLTTSLIKIFGRYLILDVL